MAIIVGIETATTVCSVALAKDGLLLAEREERSKNSHSKVITLFIEDVFAKTNIPLHSIDAVVVSKGPGSYTGLRIGVSTAKGLCYSLDKPLIAISTLQSMALGFSNQLQNNKNDLSDVLFCPMIDARRMEVYVALFNNNGDVVQDVVAEVITVNSFEKHLKNHKVYFFGDGATKCKSLLSGHNNAIFFDDIFPSAKNMFTLAERKFSKRDFEDTAYFEPFYLKDFIAGKSRVKGLY